MGVSNTLNVFYSPLPLPLHCPAPLSPQVKSPPPFPRFPLRITFVLHVPPSSPPSQLLWSFLLSVVALGRILTPEDVG